MKSRKQSGQSMVEYVVILMALAGALLGTGDGGVVITQTGNIGMAQTDPNSLLKAVSDKHRGYGYALSLSEIPETDNLLELALYYESLNKYPELSPQIKSGAAKLGELSNHLTNLGNLIKNLNPSSIRMPPSLPSSPPLPSFP